MPVIAVIGFVFLTGIGLVIAASMQFYMILGEVSSRNEQRNQISPLFVNLRLPQVLERHRVVLRFVLGRRNLGKQISGLEFTGKVGDAAGLAEQHYFDLHNWTGHSSPARKRRATGTTVSNATRIGLKSDKRSQML